MKYCVIIGQDLGSGVAPTNETPTVLGAYTSSEKAAAFAEALSEAIGYIVLPSGTNVPAGGVVVRCSGLPKAGDKITSSGLIYAPV